MGQTRTRADARQRLDQLYQQLLEKHLPADESKSLEGQKFRDWEDQAELIVQELIPAFLEERAALSDAGHVDLNTLVCPHCQSTRLRLISDPDEQTELQSPHGKLVVTRQRCQCRACNRAFSPSG